MPNMPAPDEDCCWDAAGFLKLSGMMTALPQYGHLAVLAPFGGSMGPPQLGHLINFMVYSDMAILLGLAMLGLYALGIQGKGAIRTICD